MRRLLELILVTVLCASARDGQEARRQEGEEEFLRRNSFSSLLVVAQGFMNGN